MNRQQRRKAEREQKKAGTPLYRVNQTTQAPPRAGVADQLLMRAQLAVQQKNYREALEYCLSAMGAAPNDHRAYSLYGSVCLTVNFFDEALAALSRAIQLNPSDADARVNRASTFINFNWPDLAIEDLEYVLARNSQDPEALWNRAKVHLFLAEYDDAEVLARKCVESAPALPLMHSGLGLVLEFKERWDEAAICYEEELSLFPELHHVRERLANLKLKLSSPQAAEREFSRIIRLHPQDAQVLEGRANARDAAGDVDGATTDRETARQLRDTGRHTPIQRMVDPVASARFLKRGRVVEVANFTPVQPEGATNESFISWMATAPEAASPSRLAAATRGEAMIVVSDAWTHTLTQVHLGGRTETLVAGGAGYRDGALKEAAINAPTGLWRTITGEVLICDSRNGLIRRLTHHDRLETWCRDGEWRENPPVEQRQVFKKPYRVVSANDGAILVLDLVEGLKAFARDGRELPVRGADKQEAAPHFRSGGGMSCDGQTHVYLIDTDSDALWKFSPKQGLQLLAGGRTFGLRDGRREEVEFFDPADVAFLPDGNIYIADTKNCCIRRATNGGTVRRLIGGPGDSKTGRPELLIRPEAITAGPGGELFFIGRHVFGAAWSAVVVAQVF